MPAWAAILAATLQLAAEIATRIGDVVTAKRVEDILTDRFPEFQYRAAAVGNEAQRVLGTGGTAPT